MAKNMPVAILRTIAKCFPAGTRFTQPEGGYFVWVELPAGIDALELHRVALSHNVSIAPGHLFSSDRRFANHLRINFGHPDNAHVDAALRTVGQIAKALRQ